MTLARLKFFRDTRLVGLAVVGALGAAFASSGCLDDRECSEGAGSVVGNLFYGLDDSHTTQHLRAVDSRGNLMIAVGDAGTVTAGDPATASWTVFDAGTEEDLLGVATPDGITVVAVGTNGAVVRSEDSGETWTTMDAGVDGELRSVVAVTDAGFVAVGDGVGTFSEDGGLTWTPSTGLEEVSSRDVAQMQGREVFSVGDAGRLARSDDGGASWTVDTINSQFAELDLQTVDFRNADEGRIGTNSGRILITSNGGSSWSNDGAVAGSALGIAFISTETWVATDTPGIFYRHHTDPAYVERILTSGAERFEDVKVTPQGDAVFVGENGVVLRGLLDYDVFPQSCFES